MTFRSLVNALLGRKKHEPSAAPVPQAAVGPKLSEQFELPAQWVLQQEDERIAFFGNAAGDVLTINFFMATPDIKAPIDDVDALRAFYRRTSEANGLALVETELAQLTTLSAVRTLFKARMNQIRGFAFVGAYTLPFADRSYVIKVQSAEQGVTGMREAAVMVLMGPPEIDEATGELIGWTQDPYDSSHRAAFMRNQADDQKFDAQFPDHPLSKVRRYLAELETGVRVDPAMRGLQPFAYPAQGY
ncbi:hypothetical protein WL67_01265 [Burkholderia ubonensis]|uniref:hypothetical protein n=1 Tax=Burkholderia ubonensis TaxID=101571 RepID=UPI000756ABAA|nr:hypothetical protein [Burkholderia ubonensis]KVN82402.1 hypothetical protein WJ67_00100 [Burkholderia ubonensis]KWD51653.1 hypothetical protein WL67_01265 [Burkholderia ubonensis]KWD56117.1 hypothetical protein WL66_10685 [Burkholderia ubonensis]